MILSNPQAFFGLRANVTPTAPNVRNDNEVGVAAAGLALTGGNVAYSLRAKLAEDDKLELDVLTGDASGSTISEIPDTLVITGITDPANSDPMIVPRVNDAFGFAQWKLTVNENQSVEVFNDDGDWTVLITDTEQVYAASKTSSALTPVGLTGWTVGPGTGQPVIAAGEPAFGEVTGGTGLDIYGETLPAIADVQGILIQCIAGAADIEVNGNELKQVTAGDTRCAFNVAGMPSYADTLEATATAPGTIIEITIIGKTA
jgi:hypothetical protein